MLVGDRGASVERQLGVLVARQLDVAPAAAAPARGASPCASSSVSSFSCVPLGPMAPVSTPPWPGSMTIVGRCGACRRRRARRRGDALVDVEDEAVRVLLLVVLDHRAGRHLEHDLVVGEAQRLHQRVGRPRAAATVAPPGRRASSPRRAAPRSCMFTRGASGNCSTSVVSPCMCTRLHSTGTTRRCCGVADRRRAVASHARSQCSASPKLRRSSSSGTQGPASPPTTGCGSWTMVRPTVATALPTPSTVSTSPVRSTQPAPPGPWPQLAAEQRRERRQARRAGPAGPMSAAPATSRPATEIVAGALVNALAAGAGGGGSSPVGSPSPGWWFRGHCWGALASCPAARAAARRAARTSPAGRGAGQGAAARRAG